MDLVALITGANGIFVALGAAIVAALGMYFKGLSAGKASERAKQAAAEAKARDIRDEVQNDIGTIPAEQARKELGTWDR